MTTPSFDWMRWLGGLGSGSDAVSQQVFEKWSDWLNSQSTAGPGASAWQKAAPGSIAAVTMIIQQVRGVMQAAESDSKSDDIEELKRRLDRLERELVRLTENRSETDEAT
jgi:hypothetical protein